jgi:hypothetical protein
MKYRMPIGASIARSFADVSRQRVGGAMRHAG